MEVKETIGDQTSDQETFTEVKTDEEINNTAPPKKTVDTSDSNVSQIQQKRKIEKEIDTEKSTKSTPCQDRR